MDESRRRRWCWANGATSWQAGRHPGDRLRAKSTWIRRPAWKPCRGRHGSRSCVEPPDLPDESPTKELVSAAASSSPTSDSSGCTKTMTGSRVRNPFTYDDVVIFGNDGTLPDARRQGAQTALIEDGLGELPAGKLVMAEGRARKWLRAELPALWIRGSRTPSRGSSSRPSTDQRRRSPASRPGPASPRSSSLRAERFPVAEIRRRLP